MLAHRISPSASPLALRALFSLSVNTAADWKSLYLNGNDSVNANAQQSKSEDQTRLPLISNSAAV